MQFTTIPDEKKQKIVHMTCFILLIYIYRKQIHVNIICHAPQNDWSPGPRIFIKTLGLFVRTRVEFNYVQAT